MARNEEVNIDDIDDNEPEAPRQLREYAARQKARGDEADALRREVAFLKAGIDVSTRKGQAFASTFNGDLNDTAAILADATDFDPSIIKGQAPAPVETPAPAETETPVTPPSTGSAERQALADGAIPSGSAIQDVYTSSLDVARKSIEQGARTEEAMGGLVAERARAVHEGRMQPLLPNGQRPQ
jgi:hypothetical protein